jgi:hypothetical protein
MPDSLLIPAVELCMACLVTVLMAIRLDRAKLKLPMGLWFAVVSLTLPLIWFALQAVALKSILLDPKAHAKFVGNWPLYLREVVIPYAIELWLCGALCTAVLAYFRRSPDGRRSEAVAQLWMLNASGVMAAAILLSVGCSKP